MGQANSFTGLFANSSVQSSFRQRAYQSYAPIDTAPLTIESTEEVVTSLEDDAFSSQKNNRYKLKVAFVLRWYNRRIVNLPALHRILAQSGLVDMDWLDHHNQGKWRYLEQMSLQDQIQLFKETDLLIGAHGGAFANAALFMQPHSVMIEIMPSRFLDPSFRQVCL